MDTMRIAVVIPAFNAAGSIERAIRSAQAQSRAPDEIIVVDDGSRDDTALLASQTGARVLRQANAGPGAARNSGIQATEADWIALLDADDHWLPEKLALQIREVGDPTVGLVHTGVHFTDVVIPPPPATVDFVTLWNQNKIGTSTVLLRRSAWETVGGFDESRELIGVEDYNLWLRMAHQGWRLVGIPDRLMEYHPTANSLTRQSHRFARAELANIRSIGERLSLTAAQLATKEFATFLRYGQDFFYYGNRDDAREYLLEASRRGSLPLRARLQLWATHLPLARWRQPGKERV